MVITVSPSTAKTNPDMLHSLPGMWRTKKISAVSRIRRRFFSIVCTPAGERPPAARHVFEALRISSLGAYRRRYIRPCAIRWRRSRRRGKIRPTSQGEKQLRTPDPHRMSRLNDTLTGLGLGALTEDSVTSHAGRNPNWAGTTTMGVRVFVKHISGDERGAAARLRRAITVETEQLAARFGLVTPRCLGWDLDARLIVFELLTPARTGAELAAAGEFDDSRAEQAGRLLATLHSASLTAGPPAPPFPPPAPLATLTWPEFAAASAAELELWRLLQNDPALPAAVRDLHLAQECATPAPAHCDLRLDQFVDHDGRLYLTDWEELRLADPARDVGAYAGEWLHHAITRLDTADTDLGHEDVVELATAEFAEVRPHIRAFWRSYVRAVGHADPDLAVRAAAFAGWHQFIRAFARAHTRARLSAIDRAAAGIGRTALLAPHQFVEDLGLGSDA
jgi:hypothetical protein